MTAPVPTIPAALDVFGGGRLGRFELLEPLARGTTGIVLRARDSETGADVAIKTLHTADPVVLETLRREVHALGQIRHSGVVPLLAHGVAGGIPWYAMELIVGNTLADLLGGRVLSEAHRDGPGVRARALTILQRICAPLAFLHAEGIVHRDLKPSNIMIRHADGRPVLVDFGFVARWGTTLAREALQAGGELIGTVDYMAPEQARGEYVDARADLYALGCILFETVTGRPPFLGTWSEVVLQHLHAPSPPPSRYAPDVDPRLEALIVRLLQKEPHRRLGFAIDVAAALRDLTGEANESSPAGARSYLYRPSFVGREHPTADVATKMSEVQAGRGGCVLIGGDSGSGKTRLAMELTRVASGLGFEVMTGECAATEGGEGAEQVPNAPLQPFQSLLRFVADRCTQEGPATTARLLGRRAKVLSVYEPTLRAVPGYADQPEPAALPASAERGRILSDLADLLVALSSDAPLLLVVDDLQWADDMTLALLEFLGAVLERTRVLVLGSFRREEIGPGLAGLLAASHVHRIDLNRLVEVEIGAMVASMLAMERPPAPLVRRLGRESEGNPFFVAEYLQAAVEAEFLQRTPADGWQLSTTNPDVDPARGILPLPGSLRALIARRLAALPEPVTALLEAAAVLGRELNLDLAREIVGYDEDEAMEAVRQLLQRNVLEQAVGRRVRFVHDKLREVAYAGIAGPRAIGLHGRAAVALEGRLESSEVRSAGYADLAHHWRMAGASEKAAYYYGLAGERALAMGAHKDAQLMLTHALTLDDEVGGRAGAVRRARWRQRLGVAAFGTGDLEGSISHSAAALIGLGERMPRSAGGWVGVALVELVRVLLPVPKRVTPTTHQERLYEVAQTCGQLATSYFYNADALPAAASLLRGLDRARRAGDAATVVESCARLAYVSGTLGLHRPARRLFQRAHGTAVGAGDERGRALALYLDAMYQEVIGDWARCCELGERAHAILEEIGDHPEAETALAIASHGFFFSGQWARARACGLSILRGAEERGHTHHVGWGQYLVARCDVQHGESVAAVARLDGARELLHALPDAIDIVICEGWLARALRALGRTEEAFAVATRLGTRIAGGQRPRVAQCLDGYSGWAEMALEQWRRSRESTRARDAAQRACLELRRFARVFRMARPAAERCAAEALWLDGSPSRARRHWETSVRRARELRMPYEEVLALASLARAFEDSPEGSRHAMAARQLCARFEYAMPP